MENYGLVCNKNELDEIVKKVTEDGVLVSGPNEVTMLQRIAYNIPMTNYTLYSVTVRFENQDLFDEYTMTSFPDLF